MHTFLSAFTPSRELGLFFQCVKKGWTAYHFAAMCLDIDTLKRLKSSGYPFDSNERTEVSVNSCSYLVGAFIDTSLCAPHPFSWGVPPCILSMVETTNETPSLKASRRKLLNSSLNLGVTHCSKMRCVHSITDLFSLLLFLPLSVWEHSGS